MAVQLGDARMEWHKKLDALNDRERDTRMDSSIDVVGTLQLQGTKNEKQVLP